MRCEHTHTYAHRTWTGQSHTALCLDSCTKPYHDTRAAFACCVAGPAHRVLSCVSVLSKAISFSVASIDPGSHRHRRGTVRSHTRSHGAQSTKDKASNSRTLTHLHRTHGSTSRDCRAGIHTCLCRERTGHNLWLPLTALLVAHSLTRPSAKTHPQASTPHKNTRHMHRSSTRFALHPNGILRHGELEVVTSLSLAGPMPAESHHAHLGKYGTRHSSWQRGHRLFDSCGKASEPTHHISVLAGRKGRRPAEPPNR